MMRAGTARITNDAGEPFPIVDPSPRSPRPKAPEQLRAPIVARDVHGTIVRAGSAGGTLQADSGVRREYGPQPGIFRPGDVVVFDVAALDRISVAINVRPVPAGE